MPVNNRQIELTSLGNVFMRVTSDDLGIMQELGEHLTFEAPGAKYHPLVKRKLWDGKIRLLKQNGVMYRGLRHDIKDLCRQREIEVIDHLPPPKTAFDWKTAAAILQRLGNSFPHKPFEHQLLAWHALAEEGRAVLISPTASGKSLIIFLITQYFNNRRALLIVPTIQLVLQMKADLESYGYDKDSIQILMQDESKTLLPTTRVFISTWQSLILQPKAFFLDFEMVICDEVHHASAKSLIKILEQTQNADIRIGTTGSLDNIESNRMTIQGLFGPIKQFTSSKKLMDEGKIADLCAHLIKLDYTRQDRRNFHDQMRRIKAEFSTDVTKAKRKMYEVEMMYLIDHAGRRAWIRDFVMGLDGNSMVLFRRVEADGKRLFDEICNAFPDRAKDVFFVSGVTEVEEREKVRAILEEHDHAVVIASVQLFSTGVNIKRLNNAVSIAPTKSVVRVLQSIGRTLRLASDKDHANWYDIVDDLTFGRSINYAMRHAVQRMKIYQHEGFRMEKKTVSIR